MIITDFRDIETIKLRNKAIEALKKTHEIDEERKKKGWRLVRINKNTEMLVPCGKDGKPTKEGLARIERMLNHISAPKIL